MARHSLRHLFAGLFTPTTPNRKARRANRWQAIEQLEDRTTPAIGIALNTPFDNQFLAPEGQTFTVSGTLFDNTPTPNPADLQLAPFTPPTGTTATNLMYGTPSGGAFNTRTFSFALNIVDGIDNTATPPQSPFVLLGADGTNDTSTPVTVRPQLQNVAPMLTGGMNQIARVNVQTTLSLGTVSDLGVNDFTSTNPGTVSGTITPPTGPATTYSISQTMQGAITLPQTFDAIGDYIVTETVMDKDGATSGTPQTFTVTVSAATIATTYVVAAYASNQNGDVVDRDGSGPGTATGTIGADTFATITDALTATSETGTVNVAAGTYNENLTISKTVSLVGPNANKAGDNAARTDAAIIRTAGDIVNGPAAVVTVSADGVSINGFTIDGNNANTGATLSSGADADTLYGVRDETGNAGTGNNLIVRDNVIQNVFIGTRIRGVDATGPTAIRTGGLITENLFQDVGRYDFGYSVDLRNNAYADVTNNVMNRVHQGLNVLNQIAAGGPTSYSFSGNQVNAYGGGVWYNQTINQGSPLTINNNTFTVLTAAATAFQYSEFNGKSIGILATTIQNDRTATITNNTINGLAYGVVSFNNTTTNPITIGATNTITNTTQAGVFATDIVGFNPFTNSILGGPLPSPAGRSTTNPGGVTKLVLDGVPITPATGTGVLVRGTNPSTATGGALVTLRNGVAITGGATGLALDGAKAKVAGDTTADSLADTAFAGQTTSYITLANAAYGTGTIAQKTIDGTKATYSGTLGSALSTTSTPTGFAVEDKITHFLDDAVLGFVRTTDNATFVTQSSGSIQRGITVSADGDTVNVGAGNFSESVVADVANLQLLGANAGITAGKGFIANSRGAETALTAAASGDNIVRVTADNVLVDGFTLDGTGGARSGLNSDVADGTDFANNVFTGLPFGVDFFQGSGTVRDSKFTNNPAGSFGLLAFASAPNFTGNAVDTTDIGAFYQRVPAGTILDVSDNAISARQLALGFGETDGQIAITVANNALTVTDADATGVQVTNQFQTAPITITNTTIAYGGTGTSTGSGLFVFNSGAPVNFAGTITGFATGVDATNVTPFTTPNPDPTMPDLPALPDGTFQVTAVTLSGATLTGNATGVRVTAAAADGVSSTGTTVTVGLTGGTTITGGATGLVLDGPQAKVAGNALGAVAFTGQTGDYITLANAAYGTGTAADRTINATAATFGGVPAGNGLTAPQAFAIVDKITDRVDDSSLGFVQIKAATVFVTPMSFVVTMTGASIQRAVDAIGAGTVVIQAGQYFGDVTTNTGAITLSPGGDGIAATVTLNGSLTLDNNDTLAADILSTTSFDQIVIGTPATSTVTLSNAALVLNTTNYTPANGDQFLIIDGVTTTVGTFAGKPGGQSFTTADGKTFFINYNLGAPGNVVLTAVAAAGSIVYVDDSFTGPNGDVIADADPSTPGSQKAVFGVNAFATITGGLSGVDPNGTVRVFDGNYATEAVSVGTGLTLLLRPQDDTATPAKSSVTIGSLAGVGTVNVGGQTLTTGILGSTTFDGTLAGGTGSSLVKVGTGTFTLTNVTSITYAGTTDINAGTLAVTGGLGGAVNVNAAGTLVGTGTVGGLVTNGGTVAPGGVGTTGTLTVGGYSQSAAGTLQVDITPTTVDKLSVVGTVVLAGTLAVTGTPPANFTPVTFISNDDSDLVTGTFSNFPAGQPVLINGTTYLVAYNGGDGNDVTLTAVPAGTAPITSVVVDDDYAGLAPGTVVVADDGSTRTVGLDAFGTLQAAISNLPTTGPTPTLRLSGGTYGAGTIDRKVAITLQADPNDPQLADRTTVTVASITDASGLASIALNKLTFAVGTIGAAGTSSLAGPITGTGTFVKQGTGTLTLAGANTYSGATKINEGTLLAGADEVIPDFSPVTIAANAKIDLTGRSETIGSLAGAGTVNLTNAVLSAGRLGTNTTFAGAISGGGQFVKVGGGTLTLTGANSYTGGTTIEAGTLQLSGAGTVGTGGVDTTGGGFLAFNKATPILFTQAITGDGGVIQNGTGTLSLTGANTYSGGTIVNKGTLLLGTTTNIGTGDVTVNAAGKVQVTETVTATDRVFNLNGGATLTVDGGMILTLNGASQVNGGALVGPGSVNVTDTTAFTGVTIAADVLLTVTGGTTSFTNIVNSGKFVVNTDVMGTTLSTFTNASNGRIVVSGVVDVTNFSSTGQLDVLSGGIFTNKGTTDLIFGGGSITRLGTATTTGGTIDLGDANMIVSAGIVSNNGVIEGNVDPMMPFSGPQLVLDNNSTLFISNGVITVGRTAINGSSGDTDGFAAGS